MSKRIAAWRIDSDEERQLASAADYSEAAKKQYVEFYRSRQPEYYEKGLRMIRDTLDIFCGPLTDAQRERYTVDMIYSLHRFGCMYDEYFLMGFEYLNAEGRDRFLTDKNRWAYYERMNGSDKDRLFKEKALTYSLFRKYYARELLYLSGEDDCAAFRDFRGRHPAFIVKPPDGTCGKGVYIYRDTETCAPEDRDLLRQLLANGPVVIEELIRQHPEMERLHPSSLNTVRIPTVKRPNGEVVVFHPFLRAGTGTSIVDNAGSGGIIIPVDAATGITSQSGMTEHGVYYLQHPDTGLTIPGFQIPEWEQALRFVTELAGVVDGIGHVGWDCALTENGWVMVEGNLHGQFVEQYVTKIGVKAELDALLDSAV